MTVLSEAKKGIVERLSAALDGAPVHIEELETPPQPDWGDLAFPCFRLAQDLRKPPVEIARELAESCKPDGLIASAEAAGPYVNFRFDRAAFMRQAVEDILAGAGPLGGLRVHGDEKVMIEYGQPNTHKEFHVGHLRNVSLGLSVVLLERSVGRQVIPVSYIGDVGAHVARILWAYRRWHLDDQIPEDKGKFLGAIYTEATREVEEHPELKEEVSEVQRLLEARDGTWWSLWERTRRWSLDEFEAIFKELGATFERVYYESEVEEEGKRLAQELLKEGVAKRSQGAVVVDLEDEDLGVFLILKSDGAALYATKELALAQLKFREFTGISKSVHVVDTRQSLYFRQFFATLRRMGFDKELEHLSYEFVTLKEGAMSSRSGNVVTYRDFRDEMLRRTRQETQERHPDWGGERIDRAAWTIAEGAMKFGMLKQDPDKPIVFDIEEAISFDGFTGPYVQYAHARLSSILSKTAGQEGSWSAGESPEAEYSLVRRLADFPETVAAAAAGHRPSLLAQYLFELAQVTSSFYRDVPVLAAEEPDRGRRVLIARAARSVLAEGLGLLGIGAPDEM
ncbi:hypothetical protein AMJ57_00460 [Parcubacteria bacterium SG8_24]|nr:MAG: hypothetical protein AMJ57_00460 [Parcubacteria bacterium SG8_24]